MLFPSQKHFSPIALQIESFYSTVCQNTNLSGSVASTHLVSQCVSGTFSFPFLFSFYYIFAELGWRTEFLWCLEKYWHVLHALLSLVPYPGCSSRLCPSTVHWSVIYFQANAWQLSMECYSQSQTWHYMQFNLK